MAQVARDSQVEPDIDYHLDYQLDAWRSIAEYAEWWPTLDAVDKEVFQREWEGITETRLCLLEQWAAEDRLTPAQRARFEQLHQIMDDLRPILERMMNS